MVGYRGNPLKALRVVGKYGQDSGSYGAFPNPSFTPEIFMKKNLTPAPHPPHSSHFSP